MTEEKSSTDNSTEINKTLYKAVNGRQDTQLLQGDGTPTDLAQSKEDLKDLLLDPDLDKVENYATTFNVFETLNLVYTELKHSTVLAWLCDPSENHGFDNLFIKGLLRQVIAENDICPLDIFTLDKMSFETVEVYRERDRIDVLIIVRDEVKTLYIAIENKVHAKENKKQLKDYNEALDQLRKKENQEYAEVIKIFLTPDNKEPSDPSWIPIDYEIIYGIITGIRETRKGHKDPDVVSFINQYISILRRYVMNKEEQELQDLCKNIYRNHKKALELIYYYRPGLIYDLKEKVYELLKNMAEVSEYGIEIINKAGGKGKIEFSTSNLRDKFGDGDAENGKAYPKLFYYIDFSDAYDIGTDKSSLQIVLALARKDTSREHQYIIDKFKDSDLSIFKTAKFKGAKSVYRYYLINEKLTSEELADEESLLNKLIKKAEDKWSVFKNKELKEIEEYISNLPAM